MLSLNIQETKEKVIERIREYERKLKALKATLRYLEELEEEV